MTIQSRKKRGGYCGMACMKDGDNCNTCIINEFKKANDLAEFFTIFSKSSKMKNINGYTKEVENSIKNMLQELFVKARTRGGEQKDILSLNDGIKVLVDYESLGHMVTTKKYPEGSLGNKLLMDYIKEFKLQTNENSKAVSKILGGRRWPGRSHKRRRRKSRRKSKRKSTKKKRRKKRKSTKKKRRRRRR